jgi:hypothetical protein
MSAVVLLERSTLDDFVSGILLLVSVPISPPCIKGFGDSWRLLLPPKHRAQVEFVRLLIKTFDFHDLGNKPPPRTLFELDDDINAMTDARFDRSVR